LHRSFSSLFLNNRSLALDAPNMAMIPISKSTTEFMNAVAPYAMSLG
jgi:hypothetical protein